MIPGYSNLAIGTESLRVNTTGEQNVALGESSLRANTTGDFNVSVGLLSSYYNTTGSSNVAIGRVTNYNTSLTNLNNTIVIGAGSSTTANNTARIGSAGISSIGGFANWTNVSDARFKVNVKENISGLAFIMKLRPVSYNLDMDAIANWYSTPDSLRMPEAEQLKAAETQTGFIAQEVEKAAQELGFEFHGVDAPKNAASHYGLRYAEFVVPLVKATQEQQEIIEQQSEELKLLKEQNALMQQQLDEIKKMIKEQQ